MEYLLENGRRASAGHNLQRSPNRDCIEFAASCASQCQQAALSSISVEIEFGGVSHCGFLRHAFVPQPASSSPRLVHYEWHPRSRENGPDSAGDAEKNLPLSWWYANGVANTVGIASRPTPAATPAETSRPSPEPRNASAGQSSRPISAAGSPARLQRSTRTPAETSAAATTADAASVLPDCETSAPSIAGAPLPDRLPPPH